MIALEQCYLVKLYNCTEVYYYCTEFTFNLCDAPEN